MENPERKHSGILYRSPNGDLYFRANYEDQPHRIPDDRKHVVEDAAKKKGQAHFVENDLPDDILELLNDLYGDLFGPLIGAWWVWGP
jgi:hypothetical protein